MTPQRIFIADDHPLVRAGLRRLLEGVPDVSVVGECDDGACVVSEVVACGADLVLLDFVLPHASGPRIIAQLAQDRPSTKVLVLSGFSDGRHVDEVFAAGAFGFVLKTSPPNTLLRAIRDVARGERFLDDAMTQPAERAAEPTLSARERAVLEAIARGLVFKDIACLLDLSVRTIETYRRRAMKKCALRSRQEVIAFAVKHGWLDDIVREGSK